MPTPTGLPKPGEVWKRTSRLPPDWTPHVTVFRVIERGRGDYWSMRVRVIEIDGEPPSAYHDRPKLWVDCAYWMRCGELELVRVRRSRCDLCGDRARGCVYCSEGSTYDPTAEGSRHDEVKPA